ncbi:DUF433 domain-containing protein [Synechococcus sp. J7-Johnson]|uniref:DUF433 domain-containing protein n=1 Tax=Synechococcus sp. J7-Johnson TaxID=2823737 RepID=UPI0020CF62B2|nr:DUF433 domain-containing protein [Synechococcus sp. J7-Johnson]MCP9840689.1 DUF433 domain-containing protein [Synechococcus sp. J7-Johnson]
MASGLTAATGAALLGADARLLAQEYRRVLAPPGSASSAPLRLGFRELLYFQVVSSLSAEGLQLSPAQKREVFRVLTVKPQRQVAQGEWSRGRGELRKTGAVPFSFDLSGVSRDLRYRYRLHRRPDALVESDPAICSGQPVFRGTRIPVAVVVEQLRSGVSRSELEADFPHLSHQALDYAEIQARLPKPPGRPRRPLNLQRG